MNPFIRVALWYLTIFCILTWFRDDPVTTGSVLIIALMVWIIKRRWAAKLLGGVYRRLKSKMKRRSENEDRDESRQLLSQWNKFIDGAQVRPLRFYTVLEEKLGRRRIPKVRCSRMCLREKGPLSANREYLKIRRKDLEFYICGAPFGTGFFVSSRLVRQNGLTFIQKVVAVVAYLLVGGALIKTFGLTALIIVMMLAIVGAIYTTMRSNPTCYETDMANTFRHAVQNSVLEAIDELTSVRPIITSPVEPSVPLMAELFA